MAATADAAGEKVREARKRLAAALERAKEICGCVRDKAVKAPRRPTRPSMSIPIKPSPSALGSARSSVISWPAAAPGTAINPVMGESTVSFTPLATASKQLAQRLLTIGENRLELLTVEVQEERERLLHAFLWLSAWRRSACWPASRSRPPSWSRCGLTHTLPSSSR